MLNSLLFAGIITVNAALVLYSVALFLEIRGKKLSRAVPAVFAAGVAADVAATAFMILGSKNIPITVHGILGYTALTGMIINLVLLVKTYRNKNNQADVSSAMKRISVCCYAWWVAVYIAGAALVMARHR